MSGTYAAKKGEESSTSYTSTQRASGWDTAVQDDTSSAGTSKTSPAGMRINSRRPSSCALSSTTASAPALLLATCFSRSPISKLWRAPEEGSGTSGTDPVMMYVLGQAVFDGKHGD